MARYKRLRWCGRALGLGLLVGALIFVWACKDSKGTQSNNNDRYPRAQALLPQSAERQVDMLFVIDNSGSMWVEQANLQAQFSALLNELETMRGGLPDIHLGVISPDLGTGGYDSIAYCERVGGDQGILGRAEGVDRGELCIGPGQRYLVDVAPADCTITRDEMGFCVNHDCTQADCDAVAAGDEVLTLFTDTQGCPRCRNYAGTLRETFTCLANLGTNGCGFEQPLEAMYKALDVQETPENEGFLRESAYFAVMLLTDEDDCSASQPDVIFDPDPAQDRIDSELGFLHSFRCFEFGVTCDANDREVMGPRNNCEPREDEQALLYKITRYTALLEAVKDPMMSVVAAIAGPVPDQVVVQMDAQNRPELKSTCTDSANEGAAPGVRLYAFVEHFNGPDALHSWAYTSVCQSSYADALVGIGAKVSSIMAEKCMTEPLSGCRDGIGGTLCRPCLPECEIFDIEHRGTEDEQTLEIPWCRHVCRTALCTSADMQPCEYDANGKCTCSNHLAPTLFAGGEHCAPLLYPDGPDPSLEDRDPRLLSIVSRQEQTCDGPPDQCAGRASACWYVSDDTTCDYPVTVHIIRGEDPPERTFADVACYTAPASEGLCDDNIDNDEDCLVDQDDPDCQD